MPDFDIAVIGAGSAGLSVTYAAARLGLRVALIERDRMGGDCLNVGCVPSKALLAAAMAARAARDAGRLGVRLPAPAVDWAAVRAHVRGAIAAIAPVDSAARYQALGADVLRSHAHFVAPDALTVDGRRITARRIVVATGSRPAVPDIPGLATTPFLTNETLFDLTEQPAHLLVLGGGAIGLEMAQAHAALGSRVTLLESGRLAGREDADLVAPVRAALQRDGVRIIEGARLERVAPGEAWLAGEAAPLAFSHLLVAVGRAPYTDDLDLPAGQVASGGLGVRTDAGLRSVSNRRVFAAGDIADPAGIGPRYLTHAAGYHAGIIIRRAVFRLPARLDYRALPRATYTDPELAQVGLTEAEAGEGARVLRFDLAENDRAITEAATAGLVKLVLRGGRLVGAGIVAPHAGEMIGLCALALGRKLSPAALAGMILPYPTRSEAIKRAAGSLYAERLFASRTQRIARLLARL